MPVALLAAIVVAGIVTVLTARMVAGERAVRFDRAFTESFHTADAGVQQAVFQLNAGVHESLPVGDSTAPMTTPLGDDSYTWVLTREDDRSWTVTSTGSQSDVTRTVQANITEQPLFFPGAFGDTFIALNGTSTNIDSYNSGPCTTPAEDCKWGTDPQFGTANGSMATNGRFDIGGTEDNTVRPGGAFLYDWADNPANGITESDPFGDRCDGNVCTHTYVSTVDDKLDYASDTSMAFIFSALSRADTDGDGDCDGTAGGVAQELGAKRYGSATGPPTPVAPLEPYEADTTWDVTDATSPDFVNYYCADSLEFLDDTELATIEPEKPIVIFVRDYVKIERQVTVACESVTGAQCSGAGGTGLPDESERPAAQQLQIFVAADQGESGVGGANVTYGAQAIFAGVMYAPRSNCGSSGSGGVDIFGAIICGAMDNVGNWRFHYDDQLGKFGTNVFGVGYYSEEPSLEVTP